jgi:AraC-like DNA-binding protein
MGRVLARCVERTRCEHFGLLVGQRASLSSMGALGFLMKSSASVGIALRHLSQHLHVHDRGAVVTLTEQRPYALLGYSILQQGVERPDQIYAAAIAVGVSLMRALCDRQWRPTQVHFAFRRPSSVAPYRRALGVPPLFDADATAIAFPAELLDRRPESADPLLYRLMQERVAELDAQARVDLVARLRRIVRTRLATSDCSLQAVAQRVGMHPRTLNRRLESAGTTFQALREETRLHAAREMLSATHKAASEIATMLGYADGSSFSRAFRRWAGSTPVQWRSDERLGQERARNARTPE